MATTTTNYGLTKPATTDNYDIGVFNGNTDKVDAQMKANADAISTHKADTVAHMSQDQKNQLASAIQSATINGAAVPKNGTALQFPPYPAIPGSLPANGGTASYAHYPSHAVGLADFGLRGNYISSASPSGGNDGDTWDQV